MQILREVTIIYMLSLSKENISKPRHVLFEML